MSVAHVNMRAASIHERELRQSPYEKGMQHMAMYTSELGPVAVQSRLTPEGDILSLV